MRISERVGVFCMLLALSASGAGPAEAQGPPPAASTAPPALAAPPLGPAGGIAPIGAGPSTGTGTSGGTDDDAGALPRSRGPAMRERGGRRSRAGSTASGVLFLVVLVGAMGYWVLKRLRR